MAVIWQLVQGGGGGGGTFAGSGGDAGQFNENTAATISAGKHSVLVGSGGEGAFQGDGSSEDGFAGQRSNFNGVTSLGGAGGPADIQAPGDGTGGAGSGLNGGVGTASSISGASLFYGGGGGASNDGAPGGTGGSSVGGNGAENGGANATNGVANTGSGGGGDWFQQQAGWGADGVVIIRYKTDGSDGILSSSTGGIKTTSGADTIHTFKTSGIFNAIVPATSAWLVG